MAKVTRDEPFCILVANIDKKSKVLLPNEHIANAEDHPNALMESASTQAEFLGITVEGVPTHTKYMRSSNENTAYRERNLNIPDENIINRHLTYNPEAHEEKDERTR